MKTRYTAPYLLFLLALVAIDCAAQALSCGVADPINKYSDFKTFGSVVVRCPIEKTWKIVGNAETWFRAVIGGALLNFTVVQGNGRQLQSKFNYFAQASPANPPGRTQQRLIKLSDFEYELMTTFDSSTLPLAPWTTKVTLDRVTYLNRVVDFTLISFAQYGNINAPPEQQEMVRQRIQGFFNNIFAPALKAKFDRCRKKRIA